jgi:hypothetical protein
MHACKGPALGSRVMRWTMEARRGRDAHTSRERPPSLGFSSSETQTRLGAVQRGLAGAERVSWTQSDRGQVVASQ